MLALVLSVVCCLVVLSTGVPNTVQGVWLDNYVQKGARCLDGSAPLYYIRKSSPQNNTKWVIHQQGGAWCVSLEDCYNRAFSRLGSSSSKYGFFPVMELSDIEGCNDARWCGGLFVNDSAKNPLTYDWNAVFIVYCDGGSQVGNNNSVTIVNGTRLYFSGFNNINAVIDDLIANYQLGKATEVIVGGDSAGGLATWIHTDLWREKLPSSTRVVGTPDSGFFMQKNDFATNLQWVFQQMNGTAGVNKRCKAAYQKISPDQIYQCIFAANTAPYCSTPMFALQSKFDAYQLGAIIKSSDPKVVNPFGNELVELLFKNFVNVNSAHGVFLDSWCHHCGGWGMKQDGDYNIIIDNTNGITAFINWYNSPRSKRTWTQNLTYPSENCQH